MWRCVSCHGSILDVFLPQATGKALDSIGVLFFLPQKNLLPQNIISSRILSLCVSSHSYIPKASWLSWVVWQSYSNLCRVSKFPFLILFWSKSHSQFGFSASKNGSYAYQAYFHIHICWFLCELEAWVVQHHYHTLLSEDESPNPVLMLFIYLFISISCSDSSPWLSILW